jgi:hypothetical protein
VGVGRHTGYHQKALDERNEGLVLTCEGLVKKNFCVRVSASGLSLRRPQSASPSHTIDSKPQSDKGPSHVWTRATQKRGRRLRSPPADHHSWMQLPRNHRKGAAMRSLPALETQLTGERSSAEDAGKLERRASRGAAWASGLLQIRGTKLPMCTKHPRCRLGPCAAVARPAALFVCGSILLEQRSDSEHVGSTPQWQNCAKWG